MAFNTPAGPPQYIERGGYEWTLVGQAYDRNAYLYERPGNDWTVHIDWASRQIVRIYVTAQELWHMHGTWVPHSYRDEQFMHPSLVMSPGL